MSTLGPSRLRPRLLLPLAAAAALACQPDAALRVGSIQVAKGALADPLREAGLDDAAVEASARAALAHAGFTIRAGEGSRRARVDVVAVRLVPGERGARVEVATEIELSAASADGATLHDAGIGSEALEGSTPPAAFRSALEAASTRAAEGLAIAIAAERKPEQRLIEDLGAADARVRDQAVRTLADRRSAAAVPALVKRLDDPDPDVVHRAVGALAQIRDPRAVGPLIDVSRRGDPGFTARIARIIGDVGGPEAQGYLLTLESGHPDPRVRRAAHEALAEMSGRERAAAPVATGR